MDTVPKSKRKPPIATKSRKGVPNKATKQLKDMILQALDGAGGAEYLERRANDPRTASAFLALIGKVLPMTIVGDAENPLQAIVRIERVIVRPTDKHP